MQRSFSGSQAYSTGWQVDQTSGPSSMIMVQLDAGDTVELQAEAQRADCYVAAHASGIFGYLLP
ncbi:MAG: hypothetical protein GDA53_10140 [Rhodobacteraceae bacterium]|nr:hypothetical protein [Paracoccaceae bacterium]